MEYKTCSNPNCFETNPQPVDNFYVSRRTEGKVYRLKECKTCRNSSDRHKAYHKNYRESEAAKNSKKVYMSKPRSKALMLWHNMNYRCDNHELYKNVSVKMTREEWLKFAVPAVERFLKQNPGGRPSVHRRNDSGDYEVGNIEIIDRKENILRSSFIVKYTGLARLDNKEEMIVRAAHVVKLAICDQLGISVSELVEELRRM